MSWTRPESRNFRDQYIPAGQLCELPYVDIDFCGIRTDTHALGMEGWHCVIKQYNQNARVKLHLRPPSNYAKALNSTIVFKIQPTKDVNLKGSLIDFFMELQRKNILFSLHNKETSMCFTAVNLVNNKEKETFCDPFGIIKNTEKPKSIIAPQDLSLFTEQELYKELQRRLPKPKLNKKKKDSKPVEFKLERIRVVLQEYNNNNTKEQQQPILPKTNMIRNNKL